jgi:hypothetical protein
MSSTTSAMSGGSGFDVNLDALLKFGDELQHQYDGLVRLGTSLASIRSATEEFAALGDFPEARMLVVRHHNSAADLAEVLHEITNAMDYAGRVTHWVASMYAQDDAAAAYSYDAQAGALTAYQPSTQSQG